MPRSNWDFYIERETESLPDRQEAASLVQEADGSRTSSLGSTTWRTCKFEGHWCGAETTKKPSDYCAAHMERREAPKDMLRTHWGPPYEKGFGVPQDLEGPTLISLFSQTGQSAWPVQPWKGVP